MIPITASFLRVLSEEASLDELVDLLGFNKVLLVGPSSLCAQVALSMQAIHQNNKTEFGKTKLLIVHASSLSASHSNSMDSGTGGDASKPNEFIPYIIIISHEGSRAMKNIEDNLTALDIEYLAKPSVDAINWRSDLSMETKDRTPVNEVVALSARFKIVVHTIYGDHQDSIDKNVFKLYNRMKTVINYSQVRHY